MTWQWIASKYKYVGLDNEVFKNNKATASAQEGKIMRHPNFPITFYLTPNIYISTSIKIDQDLH